MAYGVAERVGFEPTCPLRDKTLSRRPRYDHFGTSPYKVVEPAPSARRARWLALRVCSDLKGSPTLAASERSGPWIITHDRRSVGWSPHGADDDLAPKPIRLHRRSRGRDDVRAD